MTHKHFPYLVPVVWVRLVHHDACAGRVEWGGCATRGLSAENTLHHITKLTHSSPILKSLIQITLINHLHARNNESEARNYDITSGYRSHLIHNTCSSLKLYEEKWNPQASRKLCVLLIAHTAHEVSPSCAIETILASDYLLSDNKKFQWQNITPSEYWTCASNDPLIPSPTLSFLH